MHKSKLPKLTPPEFEIMEAVWGLGEATITGIMESVNASSGRQLKRSTFQVQMQRLEEKGWLAHREDGKRFLFRAAAPKEAASAEIVRDLKDRIFGGSCAELVKALFNHSDVSKDELKKIHEMIDKYEG